MLRINLAAHLRRGPLAGAVEGDGADVSKMRFWKLAFESGMKPCVLCGEPVGGRCPPCDRVICFECTVPVRLEDGAVAWRCRVCAAGIVLSGRGERA